MEIKEMKILICDDSLVVRKKAKDLLYSLGCESVTEAVNGEEAIKLYELISPDLVFMDIVMPVVDGIEAVKEIIKFDPDAKIVMASSVGTQSHIKQALDYGAFDFLQKPLDDDDIKKVIEHVLKGGK